jgi:uncharacterized membrane protein YfcA
MAELLLPLAVGLLLGTALGMFGGGGGILAVPLLVGLLGMDVDQAATTSLVIVLFGAIAGLVSHHRARRVRWRAGATFGSASIVGAIVGASLAIVVADWVKLAAFAALLLAAGVAMLRNARAQSRAPALPSSAAGGSTDMCGMPIPAGQPRSPRTCSLPLVILLATGTGLVTGFLGVGGGFLVVPALVLTLRMPVAYATATGLVVVAMSSLSALVVRLTHTGELHEPAVTVTLITASVLGSLVAARLSGRVPAHRLAMGFATLVLAMSALVTVQAFQSFQAPA